MVLLYKIHLLLLLAFFTSVKSHYFNFNKIYLQPIHQFSPAVSPVATNLKNELKPNKFNRTTKIVKNELFS